jgi:hypothetical protein
MVTMASTGTMSAAMVITTTDITTTEAAVVRPPRSDTGDKVRVEMAVQ